MQSEFLEIGIYDQLRMYNPINTSPIPLQDPVLNHVASNGCGVVVVGGDDGVEFFFGVFGVRGKLACDYL